MDKVSSVFSAIYKKINWRNKWHVGLVLFSLLMVCGLISTIGNKIIDPNYDQRQQEKRLQDQTQRDEQNRIKAEERKKQDEIKKAQEAELQKQKDIDNQAIADKIEVTSQIIKKVDSYYRYFFDIRNKSDKDFKGEVKIFILNSNGEEISNKTFNTSDLNNDVIAPLLGMSRSIDYVNLGNKYKFEVKIDGKVYKSSEVFNLSDKFEEVN